MTNPSSLPYQIECPVCKKAFGHQAIAGHMGWDHCLKWTRGRSFDCWCGVRVSTMARLWKHWGIYASPTRIPNIDKVLRCLAIGAMRGSNG